MNCRPACGACCIAPSISSAIPGMPQGKPAGVRCVQMDQANRCLIFGRPERPAVCAQLRPDFEMCASSATEALAWLTQLERETRPWPNNQSARLGEQDSPTVAVAFVPWAGSRTRESYGCSNS